MKTRLLTGQWLRPSPKVQTTDSFPPWSAATQLRIKRQQPLARLKKLLVAVDLSPASKKVLAYADGLAAREGGRLTLLNIVEMNRNHHDLGTAMSGFQRLDDAERQLLELAAEHLMSTGFCDLLVQTGKPAHEIVNAAKTLSVDVIIIGAPRSIQHARGLRPGLTDAILRHAPCPTLVIPLTNSNRFLPSHHRVE